MTVELVSGTEAVQEYATYASSLEGREPITHGTPWLDKTLGNVMPGTLTVVGADTNTGKTFFSVMLATGRAASGSRSLIVSGEDPLEEIGRRLSLYPQTLADRVLVWAPPVPHLSSILEAYDHAAKVPGLQTVYVDYLQLLVNDVARTHSRADDVRTAVTYLKGKGKEHRTHTVLNSQFRRPAAGEQARPSVFRLKESGDIENMAEYILLLNETDDGTSVRATLAKSKTTRKGFSCLFTRKDGGRLEEALDGL